MAYRGGSTWSWSCSEIAVQGHYLSGCNFRITTPREKLTSRKEQLEEMQETPGTTGHEAQP
jgi:hypothetical protein